MALPSGYVPSFYPRHPPHAHHRQNQLSRRLLDLSTQLLTSLRSALVAHDISPALVRLPSVPATPIVPVLTPHPRPLAAHLRARGLSARPITWPTVPKGADRIRVCLHASNSQQDVDRLVGAIVEWAEGWARVEGGASAGGGGGEAVVMQAKL